jgi:hypothetical protein
MEMIRFIVSRVARWHLFIPKITIWVIFGVSCNGKCMYVRPFGLSDGHLVYFRDDLVCFVAIWNIPTTPFWYVSPRKIWQPWICVSSETMSRHELGSVACGSGEGLPDGLFSNQKSQFGQILEGLRLENVDLSYAHLGYFTDISDTLPITLWYILCSFGTFFLVLVSCTKKNLATLLRRRQHLSPDDFSASICVN